MRGSAERYSLTMSFWVVPRSSVEGTPCSAAFATHAHACHAAEALIVIEVFIGQADVVEQSSHMAKVGDGTSTFRLHLRLFGIRVETGLCRKVEGNGESGLASRDGPIELILRASGRVT